MDVFALRNQLIHDYADYIESFINVSDERIREQVDREMDEGLLWPDPLLQLNPSFEPGPWIDDLVDERTLHPQCCRIFRIKRPIPFRIAEYHGGWGPLLCFHGDDSATCHHGRLFH